MYVCMIEKNVFSGILEFQKELLVVTFINFLNNRLEEMNVLFDFRYYRNPIPFIIDNLSTMRLIA